MKKKMSSALLNFVSTNNKSPHDEEAIMRSRLRTGSNNATAKELGIPRRSVDRAVKRVMERALDEGVPITVPNPKILFIDIETAPMLTYLWRLWVQGGVNHVMQEHSVYIISWAAKWLGEDEVMSNALCYAEDYHPGMELDRGMLQGIWELLDEADFVVGHNGDKFDIKHLNTQFLLAGFHPPSPYRQIDTLKMVKRMFSFDSNRLDYLLRKLFGRTKEDVGGFETWRQCVLGNMEAWERMLHYNRQDVVDLEEVYLTIRAWDKSHPSVATGEGRNGEPCCTVCGSENVHDTGRTQQTNVSRFQVYRCGDCGTTVRGRSTLINPQERSKLLVKAK